MENELKLTELEINKLDLSPDQILVVKIFVDDTSQEDLGSLRSQLEALFPNNKIMLFALPSNGRMEMDVLDVKPKTEYCENCSCGKNPFQGELKNE